MENSKIDLSDELSRGLVMQTGQGISLDVLGAGSEGKIEVKT